MGSGGLAGKMTIDFSMTTLPKRVALLGLALGLSAALAAAAGLGFVASVAADPKLMDGEMIEATAGYFPNSAPVWARYASHLVEERASSDEAYEVRAERALQAAERAVRLAPGRYENWMLLAAAHELTENLPAAEKALEQARLRAPGHVDVRWRIANLRIRAGLLPAALADLREVVRAQETLLPQSLNLVWQAGEGRLADLEAITDETPKARLTLARFLAQQREHEAAANVFRALDRRRRLDWPQASGRVLNELLAAKQETLAVALWRDTIGAGPADLLWNGGFEAVAPAALGQFDWQFGRTKYAEIGLSADARTGRRALEIRYAGKETTRFDGELQQRFAVTPGARYRLEFFVRTENLVSPDGPRIAVLRADTRAPLATSDPFGPGSQPWTPVALEFTAPTEMLVLALRQTPQFSYASATTGRVWLDDFHCEVAAR